MNAKSEIQFSIENLIAAINSDSSTLEEVIAVNIRRLRNGSTRIKALVEKTTFIDQR